MRVLHPLSSLTIKNEHRRTAAIVGSIAVGIQAVLFTDYDIPVSRDGINRGEKHVFTDLQKNYRKLIDRHIFGIVDQQQNGGFGGNGGNSEGASDDSGNGGPNEQRKS